MLHGLVVPPRHTSQGGNKTADHHVLVRYSYRVMFTIVHNLHVYITTTTCTYNNAQIILNPTGFLTLKIFVVRISH